VTGVGHESDTTLVDFVSDLRASTPTNAAQLALPDRLSVRESLRLTQADLRSQVETIVQSSQHRAQTLLGRLERLGGTGMMSERIHQNYTFLRHAQLALIQETKRQNQAYRSVLKNLDPRAVLQRGYAIVWLGEQLAAHTQVKIGDTLSIELAKQRVEGAVTHVESKDR